MDAWMPFLMALEICTTAVAVYQGTGSTYTKYYYNSVLAPV